MWKAWPRVHHFLRGSTKRAFFLPFHHIWKAKNDNPLAAPFAESLCSLCFLRAIKTAIGVLTLADEITASARTWGAMWKAIPH